MCVLYMRVALSHGLLQQLSWFTIILQCIVTAGCVKIVPNMTYNVFGGTLNPTLHYSRIAVKTG